MKLSRRGIGITSLSLALGSALFADAATSSEVDPSTGIVADSPQHPSPPSGDESAAAVAPNDAAIDAAAATTSTGEDAPSDQSLATIPVSLAEPGPVPEDETSAGGSRLLGEIIVTAQKREENLQEVPISVSAFSADVLDAKGVVDPTDLNTVIPAFQFGSTAGFTTVYLRGVGSDAFLFADPSVALYIDGIYFPFSHGLAQSFGEVDRIEVLKGPQGTLFGRNATGGAINVVSKSPTQEFGTSITASYAQRQQLLTKVSSNIPLTDSLSLNVSGLYNNENSFQEGEIAGRDFPKEVSKGARLKLKWSLTDNLDITLAGFQLGQSGANAAFQSNINPSPLGEAVGIEGSKPYKGSVNDPVYFDIQNTVYYQQTEWRLDPFDMKVLASHQYQQNKELFDYDGSTQSLAALATDNLYAKVKTAEVQILSNRSSWGSEWLEWIGGAYYFKSRQGFDPLELFVASADLGNGQLGGITLPTALTQALGLVLGATPVPNGRISLRAIADTDSVAGFAQTTLHFTDWMDLTLGGRYQDETRKIADSNVGTSNSDGSRSSLIDYENRSVSLRTFRPKVSLSVHPTDDVLTYFSWQKAVKSGAFNVVSIYEPPAYVRPEELTAIEVGVKSDLFGGLVRLNGSVFQSQIKDLQVQFVSLLNGGVVSFENAPRTRIRGVDFDVLVQILPELVDDLVVVASGAYLKGKYLDYPDASGYDENNFGLFSATLDFTGNRTVRTPKYSGSVGVNKTFSTPYGPLELAADAYHNSGFFYTAQNTKEAAEKSYEIVNAHISFLYEPWDLRMTAFGDNINKAYHTNGVLQDDFGTVAFEAPPETYGLRMQWNF